MPDDGISRRRMIKAGGLGLMGATLAGVVRAEPPPVDVGRVEGGKVEFPRWTAASEAPAPPPPAPLPPAARVGFAVVGLGRLSLEEILPAFAQSKKARLAAVVSGRPEKAAAVARQYGLPPAAIYRYEDYERLAQNPDVHAVYIVLPNSLHREYTERAAAIGKHVFCEKPMATNAADAQAMIDACKRAGRHLMIAYRCQYEPFNREVIRLVRSGALGTIKMIEASNSQNMAAPDQWRLKKALAGGGALPDIGIYCLNAARYVTGEEPVQVWATIHSPEGDPRFREVEESVGATLRFPSGIIAQCSTSYGAHTARSLRVYGADGWAVLENAFAYRGHRLRLGRAADGKEMVAEPQVAAHNQFALELDHMATCILDNRGPRTPGEEGLQDHRVMDAVYESAASGRPVTLPASERLDATRGAELEPV